MTAFALAASLLGCGQTSIFEGTLVGNPGDGYAALAEAKELSWTSATLQVRQIEAESCDASAHWRYATSQDLDVAAGAALDLPTVPWCTMTLHVASPLDIEGTPTAGGSVSMSLALEAITLSADETVQLSAEEPVFLELGGPGWVSASRLGVSDGSSVVVDDDHPLHDDLADALAFGSALWADPDGDRALSVAERDAGPLAGWPAAPEDTGLSVTHTGRGCQDDVEVAGLLLLVGLGRRRRWTGRRRPR